MRIAGIALGMALMVSATAAHAWGRGGGGHGPGGHGFGGHGFGGGNHGHSINAWMGSHHPRLR